MRERICCGSLYPVDLSCQLDVHENEVRFGLFGCSNGFFTVCDHPYDFIAEIFKGPGNIRGDYDFVFTDKDSWHRGILGFIRHGKPSLSWNSR